VIDQILQYITIRDELPDATVRGQFSCPAHDDRHPSAYLYPNQKWWCFVCNKGGNVIDYVSFRDGISNRDAIHYLTDKYSLRGAIAPEALERRHKAAQQREEVERRQTARLKTLEVIDAAIRWRRHASWSVEIGSEAWHQHEDWLANLEHEALRFEDLLRDD